MVAPALLSRSSAQISQPSPTFSRTKIVAAVKASSFPSLPYPEGFNPVYRVNDSTILKCGSHVHISEATTMRLVAQRTSIRLPTVIDAWTEKDFHSEGDESGFILMSYIPGRTVIWDDTDELTRQKILSQLIDSLAQLHQLRLPSPGNIDGQPSKSPVFGMYEPGPFPTISSFEDWLDGRLRVMKWKEYAPLDAPSFAGFFNSDEYVLCHMDIAPRNLVLDHSNKIWILDWAYAGAYPVIFERLALRQQVGDKGEKAFKRVLEPLLAANGSSSDAEFEMRWGQLWFALGMGSLMQFSEEQLAEKARRRADPVSLH